MFEVNEAGVVSCNGASKEVDDDINCSISTSCHSEYCVIWRLDERSGLLDFTVLQNL